MRLLKLSALFFMANLFGQFAQAQTVDEVITKYIDAMGGKEKIMALKSVKMDGSLSVQGIDVGVVITSVNGVGSRTDISVPGMGDGFQVMNTKKGWDFLPFQGQSAPEEVPAERVTGSQNLLDLSGPLVNYKEKGNKVELLGKETVDGAEAYKLKVINKEGKESTYFIDIKSGYKIKTLTTAFTAQGEMEVEATYTDFKKNADGFVFPYSMTNANGTIDFSSIETNKPVDEKIFTIQ